MKPELIELLKDLADVLEKHSGGLCYTKDDDGVHVSVGATYGDFVSIEWPKNGDVSLIRRIIKANSGSKGERVDEMTTEQHILAFATFQWGLKDLSGVALKLAEECGEIAGAIIKTNEGRSTHEELDKEMGDALIVLSQLAANRGTTLEKLRADRFAQIQERAARKAES